MIYCFAACDDFADVSSVALTFDHCAVRVALLAYWCECRVLTLS